jgi:phosphate/sulfate permease
MYIFGTIITLFGSVLAISQDGASKNLSSDGYGAVVAWVFVGFIAFVMLLIFFKVIQKAFFDAGNKKSEEDSDLETKPQVIKSSNSNDKKNEDEISAAISMALYEMDSDIHDIENTILTLKNAVASYSPWSSKIYGLRKIPVRRF